MKMINMQISYNKKDCETKDVKADMLNEIKTALDKNLINPVEIRGVLNISFNVKEE